MVDKEQPLFNEVKDTEKEGYVPQIREPQPPYTLDELEEVDPDEYAVFTHSPRLVELWNLAVERVASPWGVLGVALALTSARLEPTVKIPPIVGSAASLNVLVALVGRSGAGKGASVGVATDVIRFMEAERELERPEAPLPLGSGQGIAETFREPRVKQGEAPRPRRTRALFEASEIDTLDASTKQRGSTLMPVLRQMYSGENLGSTNASEDTSRNVPKHSYRASLVCGVQPKRSGAILNEAEVAGGTPQRWLWLDCEPYPIDERRSTRPETAPPIVWVDIAFKPREELLMDVPEEVVKKTRAMRTNAVTGRISDPLEGHANLTRIKVACLLAVFGGRRAMTMRDWEVSGLIMKRSNMVRKRCQDALQEVMVGKIADTARRDALAKEAREREHLEATKRQILRKLEAYGRLTMGGAAGLKQKLSAGRRPTADDAMEGLVEDGLVLSAADERGQTWFYLPNE